VAGDLRTSGPLSPAEILPSVRDLMARHAGPAVTLACRVDPGLPPVETDREALHHLLQSLLFTAFEAVGGEGAVVLGASRHAGGVAFFVEDDGRLDTDPASWPSEALRGRPLVFAVARTIAGRHGGTCEAARQEGRTQVTVVLPAAEATT